MEHVLLIDANSQHASDVANALVGLRCVVTICFTLEKALSMLEQKAWDVLVYSPGSVAEWHSRVECIRSVTMCLTEPPQIVCLLPGPRHGPSDRIYAARKGFTVIYEL